MHAPSKISPEVLADGLFRLQFPAMGTRCEILYAANSMGAADIFRKNALDWVHRFETRYSRFRDDSLICRINDVDRYKRYIAVCFSDKKNLNKMMVKNGWAIAYRYYSKDYIDEEFIAKRKKLGIWRGTFEEPYIYRKKK